MAHNTTPKARPPAPRRAAVSVFDTTTTSRVPGRVATVAPAPMPAFSGAEALVEAAVATQVAEPAPASEAAAAEAPTEATETSAVPAPRARTRKVDYRVDFQPSSPDWREESMMLRPSELTIDPDVQRPPKPGQQQAIARDFKVVALGTSVASARPNRNGTGYTYILLDGQQRRGACSLVGYDEPIKVTVHYNLTRAEEAQLFILHNNVQTVTALDKHPVAAVGGDPVALTIDGILRKLHITFSPHKSGFAGAVAARRILERPDGAEHFEWALKTLQAIYKNKPDSDGLYHAALVEGFARFHEVYGGSSLLNVKRLQQQVATNCASPGSLRSMAKQSATINGVQMTSGVVRILVRFYNQNLQEGSKFWLAEYVRKS